MLALNEYDGVRYTGNSCLVYVDYIMYDPEYVKKDMVVMAIKPCRVSVIKNFSVPFATAGRSDA